MKTRECIDLTTKESAIAYLRGLAPNTQVVLPDRFDRNPHEPAADAVAVISDCTPYEFANLRGQWTWTAGELVKELDCPCHFGECHGPVPPYCPLHDGDYSSWLASNNID